ncbi:MAG: hypothetical protein IT328_12580 [Caldilineaceae bacterium]|nr:hypothetical protein [Caldilineaceae bacterium]
MTLLFMRQAVRGRWYFLTAICALTLLLAACGGRLSLPGALPTAQSVAAAPAQPAQFNPSLSLSPSNGHAGIYVQVTGAGWPPHMMVVVALSDPSGISTTVASNDTDATGTLSTGFLYPIDARWLLSAPYTVVAESADGQFEASAVFTVVEPGAELTPTLLPTTAPTSLPTATATVTPIPTTAPTAAPTAIATATPTALPTSIPTASPQPVAEVAAEATPVNNSPLVKASFVPAERRGSYQRFTIEARAAEDANLHDVVAILQIPPQHPIEEVKTKVRQQISIKLKGNRIEISAPEPQKLLDQIRRDGGIRVQPGQMIEFKMKDRELEYKVDVRNDTLRIEAPTLLLQVTAIDAQGTSHQVTVSLPVAPRGGDDDGGKNDRQNNDRDKDRDKDRNDDGDRNSNRNRDRGRDNSNNGD